MMRESAAQRAFTLAEMMIGMVGSCLVLGALLVSSMEIQKALHSGELYAANQTNQHRLIDYVSRDLRRAIGIASTQTVGGGGGTPLAGTTVAVENGTSLVITLPGYYASNTPTDPTYGQALPVVAADNYVDYGTAAGHAPGVRVLFSKVFMSAENCVCFVRNEADTNFIVVRDADNLRLQVGLAPDGRTCTLQVSFASPLQQGSPTRHRPRPASAAQHPPRLTMRAHRIRQNASTLVLTLAFLAILAATAAFTLRRVSPRYQLAAQAGAWQEARLSAEAGIDVALADVTKNATGFTDGSWSGWKQSAAPGAAPVVSGLLNTVGSLTTGLTSSLPGGLGSTVTQALASTLSQVNSVLSVLGNPVRVSAPIFLDNVPSVAASDRPTNVDVQLWAVYPTPSPYYRWFRLRAMATCAIPPVARLAAPDSLEPPFRRYSLHDIRPQLLKDDVGTPMNVPTPNTSRIIEVLVEPVLPFELALLTEQSLSLGTSGTWAVDSYDSRDPQKSAPGGLYPGQNSAMVQSNGNIASNAGRPANSLYGPLVAANGTLVRGGVATNGGDDPSTPSHENVSGAGRIDPTRVQSDFYRQMPPFSRPTGGVFQTPPLPGQAYIADSASQPSQYLITQNLNAFSVTGPADGSPGAVILMVNGDLDVPTGTISIPANVTVQIFVEGNVDFHNRSINTSRPPGQLQIYGENAQGQKRTVLAYGNAAISAAFYGPDYDVSLDGNVDWSGSVAAHSFEMVGGGTGGFHYDEALGMVGAPISFRIARYVEDVRE